MKNLAILGGSGHGKVVADAAQVCGWERIDFFDDAWPARQQNGHWQIMGGSAELLARLDTYDGVFIAIGNNNIRHKKLVELEAVGAKIVSIIHPNAVVSQFASIDIGTVVLAGVVVNVDTVIGRGVILNTCCSVDHDCVLHDGVHICPGARLAGGIEVGELSWLGIGSSVRQSLRIGSGVVVGAGAVVVADIADNLTVAGVPARKLTRV
ncbi:sugar O-acyltransferase, sialic acid O-acetyltransferase NeuD family [Pseudomonas gessardii]|uniref:NeuD/PglB/VioB family sugar acetyltransferase n=1 Tax=Pseudomonas gessardii TaxID=78544 RepID=UPI000886ACE6|nr:NeuD/PglB/VioB family sugar acetyltransferase [Pseudomonas gessardii]MRU53740.1 acetyltransferase [Pseudomonas gessardii]ONH37902.1 acetyltransferase [Pseudomonas gessardii]SDQ72647.1 sugar O-acyltransferase, sialic acid O-acetyltransferase NeuD family [Pseudomonas gessardii]